MPDDLERYLALFPGPKGENAEVLRRLSSLIIDDHLHWRRNYFPDDPQVTSPSERLALVDASAALEERVEVLAARLRRSFPFHSPRYIAHQQSEPSLASLVGNLAGLLYNSNDVTTESGNVTVEMELDVASRLLGMIGYRKPPATPSGDRSKFEEYLEFVKNPDNRFGWCHLTSGGTSANIEAIWVARNVAYHAVWIARVVNGERSWDFDVNPAATGKVKLSTLEPKEILNLPPSESVQLLSRLNAAATPEVAWKAVSDEAAGKWHLPKLMDEYRPAVFVSGARHYSITKAVEMLGLGNDAIVRVDSDSRHRMDVRDLRKKILEARDNRRIALAVIAIIGTTEEGAVDPLDEILEVRSELESEHKISFWVHADAAWGGYLASLGVLSEKEKAAVKARAYHIAAEMAESEAPRMLTVRWVEDFIGSVLGTQRSSRQVGDAYIALATSIRGGSNDLLARLDDLAAALRESGAETASRVVISEESLDVIEQQQAFLDGRLALRVAHPSTNNMFDEDAEFERMDASVLRAVRSLRDADSVTIDPHKMGYQHYACGAVAFRDDGSRLYVRQRAPYITKMENQSSRQPLVHVEEDQDRGFSVKIETLGSYTLEGSRPSAPATALWLATETLPLDQDNHGRLVRDSWRSARHLYNLLCSWDRIERRLFVAEGSEPLFRFVLLTSGENGFPAPPDTNLVIFGVVPNHNLTLEGYNDLTKKLSEGFSIAAERGDRQHSYSQPFFLSSTEFKADYYPLHALSGVARHAGIRDFDSAYPKGSMLALRATVMNPYLYHLARHNRADVLRDFVTELASRARDGAARPHASGLASDGGDQAIKS